MSKYDPLRDYLKHQGRAEFVLTFEEIEDILGFPLPRSAHRAEWWDEASPQHPREQADAIRDGGYDSRRLPGGGKVRFCKNSVFGYR
ncbi:MAG: DUF7662 domain-containing protein [Bradyrhizobium sp.]